VYVVYFKTNQKCIREYANISNYVRDVYQTAGMRDSVNMWWGAVEQVELCWPVA
jgi:putative glutathione S-transferase